ncbi:uncharacterized protein N7515_004906 [Penicillium bovifimosum]|uniref:Uncharacterized protein n=1 Tax=Penicillium bovifimosum TaxID=126998 RepID=A0A9W9H1D7_9EURO|nr:uncharacterized protein N7515_004906 [Penicillium bovifimosum]KAJ5135628.1 hypothetical protein N7515_004906 [Penicillium bovifimosum]
MGDAACPSDDEFRRTLEESLATWSSYLDTQSEDSLLPRRAIDLRSLVVASPSLDKTTSFDCKEQGSLYINGVSIWRTSKGECDLQPKVMPKQLLLAVGSRTNVTLSEDAPFSDWPGVRGLSGYDKGNYLSVLYLAWAYILSARWVELLNSSADHECHMAYTAQEADNVLPESDKQSVIEVDIGDNVCEQEALWWRNLLCSGDGWDATVDYNGRTYLSPWSVSANNAGLALATRYPLSAESNSSGSVVALEYLSRFCVHHRIYAQCSVALAGIFSTNTAKCYRDT